MAADPPTQDHDRQPEMSADEFRALYAAVSNWGRWGEGDERGALNLVTPERVAAAAALVRRGETVTLSVLLDTRPGLDNPEPAVHRMTMLMDDDTRLGAELRQGLHRRRLSQPAPQPCRRSLPRVLRRRPLQREIERFAER